MADHTQLTFYQRHFTRPIDKDPEKANLPRNRRFAFASTGFIIFAAFGGFILAGVVAAAVAVTLTRNHHNVSGSDLEAGSQTQYPVSGDLFHAAIESNFPDPTIIYSNGTWYAYGTNSGSGILHQMKQNPHSVDADWGAVNIQVAKSKDFLKWDVVSPKIDPLPEVGSWAVQGKTVGFPRVPKANTWAPSVVQRPSDNKFVMYYSATIAGPPPGPHHPPPHCVGAAVSNRTSPEGPFSPEPGVLVCPIDKGGAIDPAAFIDSDDTVYVVYKIDGNSMGHGGECGNMVAPYAPTPIMLQKLQRDAVTPAADAPPIELLKLDHKLDGPLVEAPSLVRSHEGIYFLFFSSGCTRAPDYDIKYATAKSLTGPYKRAERKLLQTGDFYLEAPGSATVAEDGTGGFRMAFHARVNTTMGGVRAMFTAGIRLQGETAALHAVQQAS